MAKTFFNRHILSIETINISRKEEIKAGMDRMLKNHGL